MSYEDIYSGKDIFADAGGESGESDGDSPAKISHWETGNDVVRTYKLSLNPESQRVIADKREQILADHNVAVSHSRSQAMCVKASEVGICPPMILIPSPAPPEPLLSIPEAHLYICPSKAMGKGNHSYVYDVEWELPRELLFEPILCEDCMWDEIDAVLPQQDPECWRMWCEYRERQDEKETLQTGRGEGYETLTAPGSRDTQTSTANLTSSGEEKAHAEAATEDTTSPPPITRCVSVEDCGEEIEPVPGGTLPYDGIGPVLIANDPDLDSQSRAGEIYIEEKLIRPATYVGFQLPHEPKPEADASSLPNDPRFHRVHDAVYARRSVYKGPTTVLRQVKHAYQYPDRGGPNACCKHLLALDDAHPCTVKVRVAAKLSIQDDRHLQREAENYQAFPDHFFEHWNGFNLVPPLRDPTPVGAIVPQFYGFYEPEIDGGAEAEEEEKPYLSPILLLEDCGKPIDPETLNIDDR